MLLENVSRIALIAVVVCAATVAAAPYQELAPRKGYVPVYIREGNTPLTKIHPGLAEAFGEIESASLKLEDQPQVERTDNAVPSTTDKQEVTAAAPKDAAVEQAVPATVVEGVKADKESDIASFDVVKGDDDAKVTADGNEK